LLLDSVRTDHLALPMQNLNISLVKRRSRSVESQAAANSFDSREVF